MNTAPVLAKPMVLTLSAVESPGASIPFPKRQITFTKDRDVVPVGRSSKVATKGFVAGTDNAWFDSPVMSRLHAQFSARMDDNKLEIKDVGSLHGTFLNDRKERIPTNQWQELKDGDAVTFGAPIWHSNEHFSPIKVKVGLGSPDSNSNSGSGAPGTGTFQVPDDSDDDGASDDGRSSSSVDQPRQIDGHNPVVQNGPARIPPVNPPVVDLTTGHGARRHVVVDLSSPCGSPIRIDDDDDVEDEELEMRVEHEHETVGDVPNSRSIGAELEEPARHEYPSAKTDFVPHVAERVPSSPIPDVEERLSWYDSGDDENGSHSPSPYSDDDSQIDYPEEEESDSEMADYDEAEDECDDDVNETEFEEDYSSDEGRLELDSPYDRNPDHSEDLPELIEDWEYPEVMPLVESLSRRAETPLPVNQAEPSVDSPSRPAEPSLPVNQPEPMVDQLFSPAEPLRPVNQPRLFVKPLSKPAKPSLSVNQPEPVTDELYSPAELLRPVNQPVPAAKSIACSIGRLLNTPRSPVRELRQQELPGINCLAPESIASTARDASVVRLPVAATPAEALIARTGKADFFQAREVNKLIFHAQKTASTRPTSSVHSLCNADDSIPDPSAYRFGPGVQHIETSSTLSIFPPPEEESDIISSDPFAASSPIANEEADGGSSRTNVGIPDIVDSHEPTPGEGKLKRKAEEISETTDEQEQWAAKTAKAPSPAPSPAEKEQEEQHTEPESEPMSLEVLPEPQEQTAKTVSVVPSHIPERPLKKARMMRVAERLGYAALGGVTAGAVIVGTLIYTAPTFA